MVLGIGLTDPGLAAAPTSPMQLGPQHVASHRSSARVERRTRFRPPRGAAAQDAARLGALVGRQCHGKADLPRNDHETVVLCSNGKTFVVQKAAPSAAATPATECSLAGTGPEPPCFDQ
ncbi:MAG TPA: hypothetical protein VKX28_04655 [Xanthobacteraceae bacterium]|nr:hypothetical protein [Xanthobacteraceae bacterium]